MTEPDPITPKDYSRIEQGLSEFYRPCSIDPEFSSRFEKKLIGLHQVKVRPFWRRFPPLKGLVPSYGSIALITALLVILVLALSSLPHGPSVHPAGQISRNSITPTSTPSGTRSSTATPIPSTKIYQSPASGLRITNLSDIPLYNLVVIFPGQRIEFGNVASKTTSEYREVPQGVYRYAAYEVEVNGQKYQQPVIDWVGEVPIPGQFFTYIVDVDPYRWQTEGQVIKLVQVRGDSLSSASTPTPIPTTQEEIQPPVQTPSLTIGKGSPTSLAVSPDGQWMAVSTQFGVYLYDTSRFGANLWFTPLPEKAGPVVFNHQSDRLGVATGSVITILDVVNGKVLVDLKNAGSSFAWAPDGRRLVSGGGCQQVIVWDTNSGAALKELSGGKCSEGYSGITVTWAAGGRIYGGGGAKLQAWDSETYSPMEGLLAEGVGGTWVSAILAAPAGNLLAQYDSMGSPIVAIIDGKQDRQIHLLNQQMNYPLTTLAWSQDGQYLAVAYGINSGLILIWNAQTGQVEQKIEGFYTAAGLGWSADGKILFGPQSVDGQIHAIEVSTGKVLRSLSGHATVGVGFLTWTMDGLVSTNGTTLTWWDDLTGEPLQQKTAGSPQEMVVSWPPTGPTTFLFTSSDQMHSVGALSSKQLLIGDNNQYPFPTAWSLDGSRVADPTHVWDASTGKLLAQLHDPVQQHAPDQVAWSPDGKRLASADSLNMQPPMIWDSQTGQLLLTLKVETGDLKPLTLGLVWSPDGKKLAAVGSLMHQSSGEDEGMILIWDAETGQQEQLLTAGMHGYRLLAVAWSPDSRLLACGTMGGELFVWNMINHTPLVRLQGHMDLSDRLAWSPSIDRLRLASIARDGTLQIWDISQIPNP